MDVLEVHALAVPHPAPPVQAPRESPAHGTAVPPDIARDDAGAGPTARLRIPEAIDLVLGPAAVGFQSAQTLLWVMECGLEAKRDEDYRDAMGG